MNYKKILIAFAHKDDDVKVLRSAIDVATKYNVPLDLLHINTSMAGVPSRVSHTLEHRYTEEELSDIVSKNNPDNIKVSIKIVKSNDIVDTIIEESNDHDLLVIGHEKMNFLESILSDSQDERIINKINCHCLVVIRD